MTQRRVLAFELSSSVNPQEKAKARGYYDIEGFDEDQFAFTRVIGFSFVELRRWSAPLFVPVRDGANMVIPVWQPKATNRFLQMFCSLLTYLQQLIVGFIYCMTCRVDFVFASGIVLAFPAVLLKPLFRFLTILRVQQGQVFEGGHGEKRLRTCLERFITRHSDVVIPVSKFCARYALERGANPRHTVVRPPMVTGLRLPDMAKVRQLRTELGLDGKKVAIFMGRLIPLKGVDYAVRALAMAREKVPQAHLLILGDGPVSDDLRKLARGLGVDHSVTFVGKVPHSDIWEYVALSDINLLPTIGDEGLGRVILESMYLGKPNIGTSTGGIVELVRDGVTGFLVPKRDAKALADRMVQLFEDEGLRDEMGLNCRTTAEQWIRLSQLRMSQILQQLNLL